jgi:tetratricopeptide (TPR) repeat protein
MSDREAQEISSAKSTYKEGFGLFVKGRIEDAIARYRDAVAIDDTLSIAWNGLSMALAKKGDLDAAVEAAEKLVELEPDDPLSHTNLSRILMQKGLIPEAEDARAKAMGLQMKQQGSS